MKTFALVFVAIASVSGLGSGPYLPSGWRPQGPAFVLPSEVQKPVPLKDAPLQETEGSGSDALREYGPPKLILQDLTQQALPDTVTEQAFFIINAKFNDEVREINDASDSVTEDVFSEQSVALEDETASVTESQASAEEKVTVSEPIIRGKSLDIETETIVEKTSEVSGQEVEASKSAVLETVQEVETFEKSAGIATAQETNASVKSTVVTNVQKTESSAQSTELGTVQETETVVNSADVATTQQETSSAQSDLKIVKETESSAQITDLANQAESFVKSSEVATIKEVESSVNAEVTQQERNANNIASAVEAKAAVEVGELNNIADALLNLENEVKAEQVQAKNIPEITESKTVQQSLGGVSVPEGFLEYGPPGFREYGPPKQESALLRTAALVEANQNIDDTVESNEKRRRRYSPKFRAPSKTY